MWSETLSQKLKNKPKFQSQKLKMKSKIKFTLKFIFRFRLVWDVLSRHLVEGRRVANRQFMQTVILRERPWTTKARGRDSRPIPPCYSLSGGFLIIIFEEGSIDRDLKSYYKSPMHISCEDIKLKDICLLILRGRERCSLVVST